MIVFLVCLIGLVAVAVALVTADFDAPPKPIEWEKLSPADCPAASAYRAAGCPCWVHDRGSVQAYIICDPLSTPSP